MNAINEFSTLLDQEHRVHTVALTDSMHISKFLCGASSCVLSLND